MTAHKYADLFKAKLDNIDLVLFEKHYEWEEWQECKTDTREDSKIFHVSDNFEYFLCLPQHKEACLHWLNGGDIEVKSDQNYEWSGFINTKNMYGIDCARKYFNDNKCEIRIKPRKEKRWIAVKWDNFYVLPRHYETKQDAEIAAASSMMGEFQYKEIEVEV